MVKFKVTLFSAIMGGGIYLLYKEKLLEVAGELLFYLVVGILMIYGFFGFIVNMLKLSDLERDVK